MEMLAKTIDGVGKIDLYDYLQSRWFLIMHIDKNENKCKEMINFSKIQFLRMIVYLK